MKRNRLKDGPNFVKTVRGAAAQNSQIKIDFSVSRECESFFAHISYLSLDLLSSLALMRAVSAASPANVRAFCHAARASSVFPSF